MEPITASQANVVFQLTIALILLGSISFKLKRKYVLHGAMMLVAVVLNVFSFLFVMLPSLLGLEILRTQPLHMLSIVALAHACIGAVSLILGTWIIGSWHLRSSIKSCVERKRVMRLVLILWSLALVVGIVLYMFLYTNF
jgi:uncharacterized membrane protein YozB (DUF420 family)